MQTYVSKTKKLGGKPAVRAERQSPVPENTGNIDLGSGGRSLELPEALRSRVQSQFGFTPESIRVKESTQVADMGAKAMAQGNIISFAPGVFDPNTNSGQETIGHELHHIKEQARRLGSNVEGSNIHYDQASESASDMAGRMFAGNASGTGGYISGTGIEGPVSAAPSVTPASASSAPVQGLWGKKKKAPTAPKSSNISNAQRSMKSNLLANISSKFEAKMDDEDDEILMPETDLDDDDEEILMPEPDSTLDDGNSFLSGVKGAAGTLGRLALGGAQMIPGMIGGGLKSIGSGIKSGLGAIGKAATPVLGGLVSGAGMIGSGLGAAGRGISSAIGAPGRAMKNRRNKRVQDFFDKRMLNVDAKQKGFIKANEDANVPVSEDGFVGSGGSGIDSSLIHAMTGGMNEEQQNSLFLDMGSGSASKKGQHIANAMTGMRNRMMNFNEKMLNEKYILNNIEESMKYVDDAKLYGNLSQQKGVDVGPTNKFMLNYGKRKGQEHEIDQDSLLEMIGNYVTMVVKSQGISMTKGDKELGHSKESMNKNKESAAFLKESIKTTMPSYKWGRKNLNKLIPKKK